MTIGKRIRDRRVELGMSADDLAARLGKNRATVYRYESDEIENMPISVIIPLAEVLRVTPAYLMGWSESMTDDAGFPISTFADDDSSKTKKAAPDGEDGLTAEIIHLLLGLSDAKKQEALNYVRYLASSSENQ